MTDTIRTALNNYVEYISTLDGVLQIYLFGSYADGTANEHSDIDLMVIISDRMDRIKTAVKISRGLTKRAIPLDVLVNCETDFNKASNEPTLQQRIKSEGILMYGVE